MMMVPTYPEDDSRALKVYHSISTMVVRVGHKAPVVRVHKPSRSNYLETASADSAETFTVSQRAVRSVIPS